MAKSNPADGKPSRVLSFSTLSPKEFETLVGEVIERELSADTEPTADGPLDYLARVRGSTKELGVEAKLANVTPAKARELARRLSDSTLPKDVLLVVGGKVSPAARKVLQEVPRDRTVEVWDEVNLTALLLRHSAVLRRFFDPAQIEGLEPVADAPTLPLRAHLGRLELENIRGFRGLELDFRGTGGPRRQGIFIGRNGTGKTTLLRCIALALAPHSDAAALLSRSGGTLVTEGQEVGTIVAEIVDRHGTPTMVRLEITARPRGDELSDYSCSAGNDFPGCFAAGYGAARGLTDGSQGPRYRSAEALGSLFDYETRLVNSELMLRRLQDYMGDDRYQRIMLGFKRALGLTKRHELFIARGGGVRVSGPGIGESIPIQGLADGYRITLGWMIDLYGWALAAGAIDDSGEIRGIALVDELEQHLHPSMQAGILGHLSRALPGMQLFATTHSALLALGCDDANDIVALHRRGNRVERVAVPDLTGYSVEDALLEDAMFDTDPVAPSTRELLDRHARLRRIPPAERTARQRTELKGLAKRLDVGGASGAQDEAIANEIAAIKKLLEEESTKK